MTPYLEAGFTLHPLKDAVTRVGRSLTADIEIDDISVSRRHALIVREGDELLILDEGSRNGTIVNGERVRRAVLHDGDVIDLGRSRLRYVEVVRELIPA
jgi:pSer/pThr/pTyr-binding forkhead associated (FHA) protein